MRVDFINSWKKGNKQTWKGDVTFRFGRITLFELNWDFRGRSIRLMLFNIGGEFMF
jgi:hypothetical protein|tara:strand:- start:593 stop:760 length:168 start_codon:yes stop_codon:yes gene_type:complete